MSLTALWYNDDVVVLGGDGVMTDPKTGGVVGYVPKLHPIAHLNACYAITGNASLSTYLQGHHPYQVRSFDELVDLLSELLQYCHEEMRIDGLLAYTDQSCVVLAGWSDRDNAYRAYRAVTYEKGTIDGVTGERTTLKPFHVYEMPKESYWLSCSFVNPDITNQKFGLSTLENQNDITGMITRYICAGRGESGSLDADEHIGLPYNVGGFAQLVILQNKNLNSRIDHHWPEDEIGQPIEPTLGSLLPPHLMVET